MANGRKIRIFPATLFSFAKHLSNLVIVMVALGAIVYIATSGVLTTKAIGTTITISDAGGTRNWNDPLSWSTGVVPTSADDVIASATSGALTINVATACRSIDTTSYTGTITHNAAITLSVGDATGGALNFTGAWTYTKGDANTSAINFVSTSNNGTNGWPITWGGKVPGNITFNGVAGKWVFQDGYTNTAANMTLTAGTLDTNNQTVSVNIFSSAGTGTKVLTLGTTSLTVAAVAGWAVSGSNFSCSTAASAAINMAAASSVFAGGGFSYPGTVNLTGSESDWQSTSVTGTNTFVNLNRTSTAAKTDRLSLTANQTITGTLTIAGNSATNRLLVQSDTLGTARTITANAVALSNVDFMDITFAGTMTVNSATSIGDAGGNSGTNWNTGATPIKTVAVTQTWKTAAGGSWSGANWSGAGGVDRVPLPQDDVSFAFAFNSGVTVTADMPRLGKSIDWTGATWTGTATIWELKFPGTEGGSVSSYGDIKMVPAMTLYPHAISYTLGGRSSYLLTTAGKQFYGISINAPGGSYTLGDAFGLEDLHINAGSFATAGYTVAIRYYFTSIGTTPRAFDVTNSTINFSGVAGWVLRDTGLTFTSTGSTINWTSSSGYYDMGNQIYNNIVVSPSATASIWYGSFSFANMTMSSPGPRTFKFQSNRTHTMTGTNFLSGTAGNLVTIDSDDGVGKFTLSKASGTVIADYDNISRSNVTGGAKWYMTTNTVNGGGNTGWLTDATAPTSPTVSSLTVNGEPETSSGWTSTSGPVLANFSGSTDPDSGVAGYYTYFGTNASADPVNYQAHSGAIGDTQTTSSSISTADDGKHFYFRVKTKDAVGNIGTASTLFDFGYDITAPTRPTFIAATPAGYTTTNSFSFTWPAGTDPNGAGGGASGIKWYEYKRATDGAWSHTADASTLTVGSQFAYQEGANAFYVRTVDNAGNISSNYQQVTYYYSGVAPAKPTHLTVSPDTSDNNSFSVSWDKPAVGPGDPPVAGYYYSVNEAPTMTNLTYVASTADHITLGPDAFATQQGANTIYVISANVSGNYSLENAFIASKTFTCQTSALPMPAQVSVVDSSDRTLDRWMLTLQWKAGTGQDANSFDHYVIYRSTDGQGFTQLATTSSTAYIDSSNLNNQTTSTTKQLITTTSKQLIMPQKNQLNQPQSPNSQPANISPRQPIYHLPMFQMSNHLPAQLHGLPIDRPLQLFATARQKKSSLLLLGKWISAQLTRLICKG